MKKVLFIFLLTFAVYLTGCTDDDDINSSNYNSPVISKTTNALAYSLVADSYTSSEEYDVTFTSDSIAYSLIISGYSSGNGTLIVQMNASSSYVFAESLNGNKVISFTNSNYGIPEKVKLAFDHFSGTVNFALAKIQ
jgi:hypothetical protein